ncbi:lantibiotic dehydratase, partial [Streptomyces daliensis]|nr:lantibiotic dehydratase [Streptomyces daliensis]
LLARRDERLAALAWQAVADGAEEITLTDAMVDELSGGFLDERYIPPHVEISARLHATDAAAVDRGEFTLTVSPGRSAGTLTARFTNIAPGLAEVYAKLPTVTDGALAAQVSVPPVYPHAENICRTGAFLPHLIPLGEHREPASETDGRGAEVIGLEDLALTATRERLHLVSVSRRRVIEPQIFHALSIEKQLPPLARFLLQVPRGGLAAWTEFDWGPHAKLPYLPRVRYRRSVLSPARWRLERGDLALPHGRASDVACLREALAAWRRRWHCPGLVELRDEDRGLRLDLDEPAHTALLQAHLDRYKTAQLTEARDTTGSLGWIDGYAHEIAFPLTAVGPPAPNPLSGPLPMLANSAHGQLPVHTEARWLHAQIPTHPERMAEIITDHLPALLTALQADRDWWFVRYRSAYESDHLRLRLRTRDAQESVARTTALVQWAQHLREADLAGPLTLGTYLPETGRYGAGSVMEAAEEVFAADSAVVAAQLRHLPENVVDPLALTAVGMVATVRSLLGQHEAMAWLYARPAPNSATDRMVTDHALRLAEPNVVDGLPAEVAAAWQARDRALAAYRRALPPETDLDGVVESLLHMHHNRQRGIEREGEAVCRRLARQVAVTWQARQGGIARCPSSRRADRHRTGNRRPDGASRCPPEPPASPWPTSPPPATVTSAGRRRTPGPRP